MFATAFVKQGSRVLFDDLLWQVEGVQEDTLNLKCISWHPQVHGRKMRVHKSLVFALTVAA